MKNFTIKAMAAALMASSAMTAAADDWFVSVLSGGAYEQLGMALLDDGSVHDGEYYVYLSRLNNNFYIHNTNESVNYGGSEPVVPGTLYTLTDNGSDLRFEDGVEYVSDAVIYFNADNGTLLLEGTPVADGKETDEMYVSGSFNDWSTSDAAATLSREPGTQIYSGRVELAGAEGETVTWLITSPQGNWGLEYENGNTNMREGYLAAGSDIAVSTVAGTYDFWFNSTIGMFRLTEVQDNTEKSVVITPSPEEEGDLYNEFTIVFNGYNTATLDPAMYDVMNGPGTFTNVESGEVVARVGGQPLPVADNKVILHLSQTIFSQGYLDSIQIEPGDEDFYKPYPDGIYSLEIPAGMITLYDGTIILPNETLTFLYKLGDTTGVETIAPEYEHMDIYTLDGVLKMRDASADDLNALPRGLYIAKGRKFIVK